MSFLPQSPSPNNKPNPVWNDQVKVGRGRVDGGAGARAIDVARHLFKTGQWNGRGLIIIHNVYDTHCNWQTFGQEPVLGRDYEFAADSVYSGAGPDEPVGFERELDDDETLALGQNYNWYAANEEW